MSTSPGPTSSEPLRDVVFATNRDVLLEYIKAYIKAMPDSRPKCSILYDQAIETDLKKLWSERLEHINCTGARILLTKSGQEGYNWLNSTHCPQTVKLCHFLHAKGVKLQLQICPLVRSDDKVDLSTNQKNDVFRAFAGNVIDNWIVQVTPHDAFESDYGIILDMSPSTANGLADPAAPTPHDRDVSNLSKYIISWLSSGSGQLAGQLGRLPWAGRRLIGTETSSVEVASDGSNRLPRAVRRRLWMLLPGFLVALAIRRGIGRVNAVAEAEPTSASANISQHSGPMVMLIVEILQVLLEQLPTKTVEEKDVKEAMKNNLHKLAKQAKIQPAPSKM